MGDPVLISPRLRCLLDQKWNETTPKKYFRCIVCRLGSQAIQEHRSPKPLGAAYSSTTQQYSAAPAVLAPPVSIRA